MSEERQITIECLNCHRRFSFVLNALARRRVPYFNQDGKPIGNHLILARAFAVPCPYCRVENMVRLN